MASIVNIQPSNNNPLAQGIALGNQITQAQTDNEKRKLLPVNTAIQAQSALNQRGSLLNSSGWRNSMGYRTRQWFMTLTPSQKDTLNKKYPGFAEKMIMNAVSQKIPDASTYTPDILTGQLNKAGLGAGGVMMPGSQSPQQASQTPSLGGQPAQGVQNTGSGNTLQQISDQAPVKDRAEMERAAALDQSKQTTTKQTRQRQEVSAMLENMLPQIKEQFSNLTNYSTPAGGIEKKYDELQSGLLGKFVPRLANYNVAKNYINTLMGNFVSKLEGYGATDKGLKQGLSYFKLAQQHWGNNPKMAQYYFNQGIEQLQKEGYSINAAANKMAPINVSTPGSLGNPNGTQSSLVKIKAPNGKIYNVPQADAQAAINQGGKKVG